MLGVQIFLYKQVIFYNIKMRNKLLRSFPSLRVSILFCVVDLESLHLTRLIEV